MKSNEVKNLDILEKQPHDSIKKDAKKSLVKN